jgi:hypothetical protein
MGPVRPAERETPVVANADDTGGTTDGGDNPYAAPVAPIGESHEVAGPGSLTSLGRVAVGVFLSVPGLMVVRLAMPMRTTAPGLFIGVATFGVVLAMLFPVLWWFWEWSRENSAERK